MARTWKFDDDGTRPKFREKVPEPRYWAGEVGRFDEFTGATLDDMGYPIKGIFIDGRTKLGPWAIMNPQSWINHGVGKLGVGYGQKYRKQPDGRWLKVEG